MVKYPDIHSGISTTEIISLIHNKRIQSEHLIHLQNEMQWNDSSMAAILGVSVLRLKHWKHSKAEMGERVQEHLIMLISLYEHGKAVFEGGADFKRWLELENFYFGGKPPHDYLKLIHGIKFVSARLTGMKYGDNA